MEISDEEDESDVSSTDYFSKDISIEVPRRESLAIGFLKNKMIHSASTRKKPDRYSEAILGSILHAPDSTSHVPGGSPFKMRERGFMGFGLTFSGSRQFPFARCERADAQI